MIMTSSAKKHLMMSELLDENRWWACWSNGGVYAERKLFQ
jgi:hypothetical protein